MDPDDAVHDRPSPISLRLVAAIIDFTIVMVLVVVAVMLGEAFGAKDAGNVVGLAVVAAYPVIGIGARGRTIGKLICSLEVRSTSGGRPGWGRAVVRFLVTVAPFVIATAVGRGDVAAWVPDVLQVVLAAAVYGPIVIDASRRGLHDRLAGTVVVCTAPPLAGIVDHLAARQQGPPL